MKSLILVMSFGALLQYAVLLVPACADSVKAIGITIGIHDERQVMHSFGASDAWSCQFVGEHWPLEKRRAIADLLFSRDVDSKGNPKGIGLSMWRFNIGAGSTEQGNGSHISTEWHRAECFRNPDGSYDWTKQKGQQWFLEAAKEHGVPYVTAFTVSPPVQYTLNGIAHANAGSSTLNIRKDALPDFARFLVDVAEHFHKKGIDLDYISPVNEPQWGWESDKQEGTPASNAEICDLTRLIASGLHDRDIPSKVQIGEAGSLEYLTDMKSEKRRGGQVNAFWSLSSPYCLANLPNVCHTISGHSYFTTWPVSKQVHVCEKVRDAIAETDPKLGFWQTEFCILEANDEIGGGWGRDLGMDTALYVARVIHNDLTIADASHWSWWLAVSQADYKDGLIYLGAEKDGESGKSPADRESLKFNGRVLPSKLLWTLGNFSRFVRPGMVRVDVAYDDHRTALDAAGSLMASAYVDKKTHQLVVVLINCTAEAQRVSITNLAGLKIRRNTFATYTTSATSDLKKGSVRADRISVSPRSVVTLVGTLE